MSRHGFLLLLTLLASPAFSQPPDLTYHTVTPCILIDTRNTGGAFTPGETRTYNVAGSCGVPAWSNNIAQAQAVALTITAISPTGSGNMKAYAADQSSTLSVLNFTTGVNVANTTPVALAQTPGAGDIKINVTINQSNTTSHVLLTVVGYYSRDMQTVHVHPVPGNDAASGTRLINALAGITDASATKRYVVKVEPGVYDVGSTMLEMKPYVDIEGSGQQATIIKGNSNYDTSLVTAVVKGASDAELRDLQVQSLSYNSLPISIAILVNGTTTKILRDVEIEATGSSLAYGYYLDPEVVPGLSTQIVNSKIKSSGNGISVQQSSATLDVEHSRIEAEDTGIAATYGAPVRVLNSEVSGSVSIDAPAGYIAGTLLDGPVWNTAACAGVYDGSFTFYASTCP